MPKPRKPENRGLPPRWQTHHGAYYYRVPPGCEAEWDGKKRFLLGHNLADAHRTFADRLPSSVKTATTLGDLFDRYEREVLPKDKPNTRVAKLYALKKLRPVFKHLPKHMMRPVYAYRFIDKATKKIAARRAIEVLSHVYTKAIEWGEIDRHPLLDQMRLEGEKPRDRYVNDDEHATIVSIEPTRKKRDATRAIQAYIRLKELIPARRIDLLKINVARDVRADGVWVMNQKTGRRQVFEWTDALHAAIDEAKAARPVDISPWLFCTSKGDCYVNDQDRMPGWKSNWQRYRAKVLAAGVAHFTDHDLRAKVASDADTKERAQELLAHADSRTTDAIYRRRPARVKPTR